jgi:hypothetical protein
MLLPEVAAAKQERMPTLRYFFPSPARDVFSSHPVQYHQFHLRMRNVSTGREDSKVILARMRT